MSISDIMSRCVAECTEDTGIEKVYELIRKCEHGIVVVIDSEAHRVPIGVVTERSICEQLIVRGKSLRGLTAGSVLDSRIMLVREAAGIDNIASDKLDSLTAIIVTNDARRVTGIVPASSLRGVVTTLDATRSPGAIYVSTNVRRSPAAREIPAFGWIQ